MESRTIVLVIIQASRLLYIRLFTGLCGSTWGMRRSLMRTGVNCSDSRAVKLALKFLHHALSQSLHTLSESEITCKVMGSQQVG